MKKKFEKGNIKKNFKVIVFLLVMVVTTIGFTFFNIYKQNTNKINYNTLWTMVDNKEVEKIEIIGDKLKIKTTDNKVKYSTYPETDDFKEKLLQKDVEVKHKRESKATKLILSFLPMGITIFIMIKFFSPDGMKKQLSLGNEETNIETKFDDVAGIDEAKESLVEVVNHLKNPEICSKMGLRAPKGVILEGPPGTGKTLLGKAVAGEAGVPFYSVNGSDFIQLFAGLGAMRIRELFDKARKNSPCVVFIDEIDTIGRKRGSSGSSSTEQDQTLNALLTELDGFKGSEGIIVIAATNRLDILDNALLRAGRFDRHMEVGYSDLKGREEILKIHARKKPLSEDVDLHKLAKRTTGFSGADLENLLNESGWNAIRENREIITWKDIDIAFNTVLVGSKKKRNILSDNEKQIVAYHEGGHALVTRLFANIPIDKISITPSAKALGYVSRNEGDISLKSQKQFFNDICIALGGRVAEKIMFGEDNVTNGASQDFKQATKIAYNMVCSYGMSSIGLLSIDVDSQEKYMQLSDEIKNETYGEIKKIVEDAEKQTLEFLSENKDKLILLAKHLLEVENLEGDEFDKLFDLK